MPAEAGALAGRCVLVTRPAQQAQRLADALSRLGARVLQFPLLHIAPPSDPNTAQTGLAEIAHSDLVIFVSSNAVRFAAELLPDLPGRLEGVQILCVGDGTAAALDAVGVAPGVVPDGASSSEALLAMDMLQDSSISGREVTLVRGEGGRDLLLRTLEERGARLRVLEVYRREPPRGDLVAFLDQHGAEIDLAIVTSGEALERFAGLAGIDRVGAMPLVLPSDRVLERAIGLGFRGPFMVPRRMSDRELAEAAERLASCVAAGGG